MRNLVSVKNELRNSRSVRAIQFFMCIEILSDLSATHCMRTRTHEEFIAFSEKLSSNIHWNQVFVTTRQNKSPANYKNILDCAIMLSTEKCSILQLLQKIKLNSYNKTGLVDVFIIFVSSSRSCDSSVSISAISPSHAFVILTYLQNLSIVSC